MAERKAVDQILDQKNIAVFGVSRNEKKFGTVINNELKAKGWNTFPVNPNADEINGEKCYKDVNSLPEKVTAAVLCIQPAETTKAVKELAEKGIKNIWIQQGAESDEALEYCHENDINYVAKECIMMFAEPVEGGHKFHRWIWKLFGKLPK